MKLSIDEINRIKRQFYKDLDEWETRAAKASETKRDGAHIYDLVDFAADIDQFGYPVHNPEELDTPIMSVAGWDFDDDED